jgi:AcrR family transcriptional regulator
MLVFMKSRAGRGSRRRQPKQRRARQTVEAVLDAVVRILKRGGADRVTTNRIAEVAGVSIGSVYQYFPDKRAIFAALHRRHIEEIEHMIQATLLDHASSSLGELVRALVEAMIEAHNKDPELHELLATEVPHRAEGTRDFATRLHGAFRLAIAARVREVKPDRDLDGVVFIVTNLVEALSHAIALRRPPHISIAAAKEEAVRAVMAYLDAAALPDRTPRVT